MKYILKQHSPPPDARYLQAPQNYDKVVNELLGLTKGILADGKVSVQEVEYLRRWLERRKAHLSEWPLNIVAQKVASIVADGIITQEECLSLGETLNALIGETEDDSVPVDLEEPTTRSCFTVPEPQICFEERLFCVTGVFAFGSRQLVKEAIVARGGAACDKILKDIDYLLVGSIVSKSWAHGNFGRKIQKVMNEWTHVSIISEQHWTRALRLDANIR